MRILLLIIIGSSISAGCFINNATAQDATETLGATPEVIDARNDNEAGDTSDAPDGEEAKGSPESDEVGEEVKIQYAQPFEPSTIGERFNAGISAINGLVAKVAFFDTSFGFFQTDKKDKDGNVVYKTDPVTTKTDVEIRAYKLGEDGKFVENDNGERVTVKVPAGTTVQRVNTDGELATTPTKDAEKDGPTVPFMVVFLAGGALFFTLWHGFINIRGFKHAIDVVRGKYTDPNDPGDVTPFRALTSALSATVGLGNIAGVAIAVKLGGPGAIFWMMILGLVGMTAKFHESTLAQLYRKQNEDGSISGGPMFYLDKGLSQINGGFGALGKVLAVIFAIFCMGGALGGGNMFQANQAYEAFFERFVKPPTLAENQRLQMIEEGTLFTLVSDEEVQTWLEKENKTDELTIQQAKQQMPDDIVASLVTAERVAETLAQDEIRAQERETKLLKSRVSIGFGMVMAVLVGVVVIGGITRIGAATSKIVPTMCLMYVAACVAVIFFNIGEVPGHVGQIFSHAFASESVYGGIIGALVQGFRRAAFSSEAGLGSSAIAHSAAKTNEPVREGFVASLEPFIDTIVICFMTAMVVLITDAYAMEKFAESNDGSAITLEAFSQTRLGTFFPYILSVSIVLFAFSTQISWCYYGERAYQYLFGLKTVVIFRLVFVTCVFVGAVASLGPVLDFSDLMILSMAFPNIIGGVILAGLVRRKLKDYWSRHKAGDFKTAEKQVGADI